MEELERIVAGRLRALEDAVPAPGSQSEIMRRVSGQVVVRRRRRRTAEAAGACLVVALAVSVPHVLGEEEQQSTLVPGPLAGGPSARPTASAGLADEAWEDLRAGGPKPPGGPSAAGLDKEQNLQTGQVLSAFGVGTDGTVLAEGLSHLSDGTGVRDGRLWRADLTNVLSAPVPVAQPAGLYAAGGGDGLTVWPERRDAGYQLMCQGPDGRPAQLGSAGVLREPAGGFHIDEDTTVWTDGAEGGGRTVWTAKGCTGQPRTLARGGYAAAFSYPYAYIMETRDDGRFTGDLQRLQIETGDSENRTVPADLVDGDAVLFAAGEDTFSVSDGTKLVIFDAGTWKSRKIKKPLPARGDGQASLTAGDDVVVYSIRPADGRQGDDHSLVYRTKSASARIQPGEAFANGPWLLHRVSGAYRLDKTHK
ncbi:MAG: hypothetical protein ABIS86_08140 [Streptosporangiaceae bacterium]